MASNNKRPIKNGTKLQDDISGSQHSSSLNSEQTFDSASEFMESYIQNVKLHHREERRERAIKWVACIGTFFGINGLFIVICYQAKIFDLLFEGGGSKLGSLILVILWIGFALLSSSIFLWIYDKSGLNYLIEDWIISWEIRGFNKRNIVKYKGYPRTKRKELIRQLKNSLHAITDELYQLEEGTDDGEEEDWGEEGEIDEAQGLSLFESREKFWHVISGLLVEVDASSRALIKQPEGASWVGCVVALRKTKLGLMKAAKKIRVYHIKVQPFIGEAIEIVTRFESRIANRK